MRKITCLLLFTLFFFTSQNLLYSQCSATPISCGSTITATTIGAGNNFNRSAYCSNNSNSYSGADKMYSFSVRQGSDISVKLALLRIELDVFLFRGGCSPGNCIATSTRSNSSSESITVSSAAAGIYYIIIDGINAEEEGFFELSLDCLSGGSTPTCSDGIRNQGETGIDCGGPCAACPTCSDGVQNGSETGVDCGGSCSPCGGPTCSDGVQNGSETGVDCGGSCSPCGGGRRRRRFLQLQ